MAVGSHQPTSCSSLTRRPASRGQPSSHPHKLRHTSSPLGTVIATCKLLVRLPGCRKPGQRPPGRVSSKAPATGPAPGIGKGWGTSCTDTAWTSRRSPDLPTMTVPFCSREPTISGDHSPSSSLETRLTFASLDGSLQKTALEHFLWLLQCTKLPWTALQAQSPGHFCSALGRVLWPMYQCGTCAEVTQ